MTSFLTRIMFKCLNRCQNCAELHVAGLYYKRIMSLALVVYKLIANSVLRTLSTISAHIRLELMVYLLNIFPTEWDHLTTA